MQRTTPIGLSLLLTLLAAAARAQTWETCGTIDTRTGEAAGDQFGFSVRNALDTDADGVDDFVVGRSRVRPWGVFYGAERTALPLGAETLCVGLPFFRVGSPVTVDATGAAAFDLDWTQPPFQSDSGAAVPRSS